MSTHVEAGAATAARAPWGRTPSGWALNLDGSAASGFSLPRLEIEQSDRGWLCRCRFGDGSSREQFDHSDSIVIAQRTAAELARGRLEGEPGAVLAALLAAR